MKAYREGGQDDGTKVNESNPREGAARLVMDKEPAMSRDEVQLVQAIQQDMLQLN